MTLTKPIYILTPDQALWDKAIAYLAANYPVENILEFDRPSSATAIGLSFNRMGWSNTDSLYPKLGYTLINLNQYKDE